jgi:ketosteroid isomerase-like protein
VSGEQKVSRKAIPLCGIVLVLGSIGCGCTVYSPRGTSYLSFTAAQPNGQRGDSGKELVAEIQKFLTEVPSNQRSTFDRFFADDVIYTRNSGQVVTKKDILADTGNPSVPRANATFTGEDFTVHQYGDTAVVNFRLVMHGTENGEPVTRSFRNTGTFARRSGVWQAVAWQATPIAEKQ